MAKPCADSQLEPDLTLVGTLPEELDALDPDVLQRMLQPGVQVRYKLAQRTFVHDSTLR